MGMRRLLLALRPALPGLRLLALAGVLLAGAGGTAEAEYRLCNKSSYFLYASLAYAYEGSVKSKGWWDLRPGECRMVVNEALRAGPYFVYAQSHSSHLGGLRTWGGRHPFCIADGTFELERDACARGSDTERLFARVEIGEAKSWVTEFTELDNYTLPGARIAGLQRLLRDVGEDPGVIDGTLGNSTRVALEKIKSAHALALPDLVRVVGSTQPVPDEIVDRLIALAVKLREEHGFRICNETRTGVWTAIALPVEGILTTRGWFRVEPGLCTKVIHDPLKAREVLTYAEADLANGRQAVWGGEAMACVSETKFEIAGAEACEDRGFKTAGFLRVDTEGRQAWTYVFKETSAP